MFVAARLLCVVGMCGGVLVCVGLWYRVVVCCVCCCSVLVVV